MKICIDRHRPWINNQIEANIEIIGDAQPTKTNMAIGEVESIL
jgi:hypothetical protein